MGVTKQFGNLASPPSSYFEFGEGSFTLWYHNTDMSGDVDEPSSSGILTTHDTTYGQWAVVGHNWAECCRSIVHTAERKAISLLGED